MTTRTCSNTTTITTTTNTCIPTASTTMMKGNELSSSLISSTTIATSYTARTTTIDTFSVYHEMIALGKLAIPNIIIQWNLFIIFPYTAMMIGTTNQQDVDSSSSSSSSNTTAVMSTIHLAAFSLGSLLGNLTCLSILEGTLSVADTLLPRIYSSSSTCSNTNSSTASNDLSQRHNKDSNNHYHYSIQMIHVVLRSMIVTTILLCLPIIPLYYYSEYILVHILHQNIVASYYASQFIRIYFIGIIPNLFFRITMRLGMAQKYTFPYVISTFIPCIIIHPILVHVLVTTAAATTTTTITVNKNHHQNHLVVDGIGSDTIIRGAAYSLVITQWIIAFVLAVYLYFYPLQYPIVVTEQSYYKSNDQKDTQNNINFEHTNTITNSTKSNEESKATTTPVIVVMKTWHIRDILSYQHLYHVLCIDTESLRTHMILAIGGIGSMMEWWFFEIICFIIGTFGIIPLCIHTIAYNLVPIVFMIPLGILGGLTIRMGHIIHYNLYHAKLLACYCMGFTLIWGIVITALIYIYRLYIIQWFTTDNNVIDGANQIWDHLCYYLLLLHIFAISQGILRALGQQWYLAIIIIICLYGITLPIIVYYCMIRPNGTVYAVWNILPICYTLLQIVLISIYTVFLDWSKAIHSTDNDTTSTNTVKDHTVLMTASDISVKNNDIYKETTPLISDTATSTIQYLGEQLII